MAKVKVLTPFQTSDSLNIPNLTKLTNLTRLEICCGVVTDDIISKLPNLTRLIRLADLGVTSESFDNILESIIPEGEEDNEEESWEGNSSDFWESSQDFSDPEDFFAETPNRLLGEAP